MNFFISHSKCCVIGNCCVIGKASSPRGPWKREPLLIAHSCASAAIGHSVASPLTRYLHTSHSPFCRCHASEGPGTCALSAAQSGPIRKIRTRRSILKPFTNTYAIHPAHMSPCSPIIDQSIWSYARFLFCFNFHLRKLRTSAPRSRPRGSISANVALAELATSARQ